MHMIIPLPAKRAMPFQYIEECFSHSQLWAIIAASSWFFFWIFTQIGSEFCNTGKIYAAPAGNTQINKFETGLDTSTGAEALQVPGM